MKKVVFLLAFLLIFCFSGCAETDTTQRSSDVKNTSNTSSAENTVSFQAATDNLLSVLHNKKPFINAKGTTVYLKDYKPMYKVSQDIGYTETNKAFVPLEYAFVDLDSDGQNELVSSESSNTTYLIFRKDNENIYGYSLPIRHFEQLKKDGTFVSSGGALIHDYNKISFNKNTYTIYAFAKFYYFGDDKKPSTNKFGYEPDYDKSVFEIDGKKVSLEEILKFDQEWQNRPNADWIKFE